MALSFGEETLEEGKLATLLIVFKPIGALSEVLPFS